MFMLLVGVAFVFLLQQLLRLTFRGLKAFWWIEPDCARTRHLYNGHGIRWQTLFQQKVSETFAYNFKEDFVVLFCFLVSVSAAKHYFKKRSERLDGGGWRTLPYGFIFLLVALISLWLERKWVDSTRFIFAVMTSVLARFRSTLLVMWYRS